MARLAAFIVGLLAAGIAGGEVRPAHLFGDHMVLQQGISAPVWGTATPGEAVTVQFAGQTQKTTAAADGKWMVRLDPLQPGGPMEMTISGGNTLTVHDVLVGEVWLGSGQSNMEFSVSKKVKYFAGAANEDQEIAAANYPKIRMFTAKMTLATTPLEDVEGHWDVCSPQTVPAFSAVGYFFCRDLQAAIHQPVGFINSSYGASTAQAWISPSALQRDGRFKPLLDAYAAAVANFHPAPPATRPATTRRARAPKDPRQDQHSPCLLWNAQIKPLQPYAIRGAVWYQGESVVGGTDLYAPLMQTLVTSWRREWGQGDFPFYVCQLAAQDAASNNPGIRAAQAQILSLPNTGMAVTIDIGERHNVHPKNKQDVGDRLCRIALANAYGKPIEYSGPVYQSMSVEGNNIRLAFTHIGGGLTARNGDLKTFVIAGKDGVFVPAAARIDGPTVIVSSPAVANPVAVRYAWENWPEGCNLYNSDGLPAAPFRTDGR